MTEKAELIATVLQSQADGFDEQVAQLEATAKAHEGARDVIPIIGKNLAGIIPQAEKEIEADDELSSEARVRALIHVGRAMQRVSTSLVELQKNQANRVLATSAQVQFAKTLAHKTRKQAELELAKAKRRTELEAEMRAAAEDKPAEGEASKSSESKSNGVKKPRKPAAKKRAPAKRTTKRKTKAKE